MQTESRLQDRLSLLSALSVRITSSLDLPTVLQDILDAACELTGARSGALAVFDASGHAGQVITRGITAEDLETIRTVGGLPQGQGLPGWGQDQPQPVRLVSRSSHPALAGFAPGHPATKTFLSVPLRYRSEGLGNLYLTGKLADRAGAAGFTPEDESLVALFAAHAALAIHHALLHQGLQTQRIRAERERERDRLKALVDTSPVGIVVADAVTQEIILVNREAQRVLGVAYQPGDPLDRYSQTLVYRRPEGTVYLPEELPLRRAIVLGETIRAEEVRVEFPNGRSVPTLINASPVYDGETGQITAAIAAIQDISPLEELEKLRSEFLGIVSHEFRTPLAAIKGSAATVLDSQRPLDDVEVREFFQIVDEQADRLRDLVDNLLDMTRIEAGSLSVAGSPVDLREMLEEARAALARNGTRQEILLQLPDDAPLAIADRRRIRQVLMNLLSNAAKFSPAASPIVIEVEQDSVQVTIHVRDQGWGIAREKMPYLFKKFSQVHTDTADTRLAGSGLGLAISKGIVEAHGGRIWADSPGEGQGATFSFTLPAVAQPSHLPVAPGGEGEISPSEQGARGDDAPDTTRRAEHQGRVSRTGERTRILAVDDEPRILRYLQRSLNEAGYQAIVTSDAREVTSLVGAEGPDLILLDLMLPDISGFDLLEQIREFSGVPVIFLTARDRDEDMVHALKMGADDYITKPFSPSELLARIEAALRRRLLSDRMEARPCFELEDLTINFTDRSVLVGGRAVPLSATEYKVLYQLVSHAGMVLTHDQLLQRVWGPEYAGETELVRSFIRNLRRKLGDDARKPRYIFTEPQVGYRIPRPQP